MSKIIAFAAPPGGGKTSLISAVAKRLGNTSIIHFDSYQQATKLSVSEINKWMAQGANLDELPIPQLAEDLRRLKEGHAVVEPLTKTTITPASYILFEMPLGKEHQQTAKHIDYLIWIDVPLDIALARAIKSLLQDQQSGTKGQFTEWLDKYLDHYLNGIRDTLEMQKRKVRVNADIVIDGTNSIEDLAEYVANKINSIKCD